MVKLSKESAVKHYEILSEIHNFNYLTLAQKVSIFYHNLEHDILLEITGKKEYYDQFNWLKNNQIKVEHNIKKGIIPKVIIDDIDSLKNWRNEGVHENKMPEPKYKSHFHTMAQTINFFSGISLTEEINNIINNKTNKTKKTKKHGTKTKDHSQYIFKGEEYNKCRLVLAVINCHVRENPKVTLNELQNIFDKKIQGSLNVVDSYTNKKTSVRYFSKDAINLDNGQKIVVCNQWGIENIYKFINKAKELGYNITINDN